MAHPTEHIARRRRVPKQIWVRHLKERMTFLFKLGLICTNLTVIAFVISVVTQQSPSVIHVAQRCAFVMDILIPQLASILRMATTHPLLVLLLVASSSTKSKLSGSYSYIMGSIAKHSSGVLQRYEKKIWYTLALTFTPYKTLNP
jgi:hypothetical protein